MFFFKKFVYTHVLMKILLLYEYSYKEMLKRNFKIMVKIMKAVISITLSWFYCFLKVWIMLSSGGYYTAVRHNMLKNQIRVPPKLGEIMQNLDWSMKRLAIIRIKIRINIHTIISTIYELNVFLWVSPKVSNVLL